MRASVFLFILAFWFLSFVDDLLAEWFDKLLLRPLFEEALFYASYG